MNREVLLDTMGRLRWALKASIYEKGIGEIGMHIRMVKKIAAGAALLGILLIAACQAAVVQKHYYAHDTVHDKYGVIAPWYKGQNGQLDYRLRIAVETLKRYPWTDAKNSVEPLPHYMYNSCWDIGQDGTITIRNLTNWANGDLGQRSSYVLSGLVDYYRYSGDPAAIAHASLLAGYLIDHCQTPADHPWPRFLISVPTKGKPYYDCDPTGYIQLDITAEVGLPLLRVYQITGNKKLFDAAKHWGDLYAEKCDMTPGHSPWSRYANPKDVKWQDHGQRAGVAFELYFLDELIRMGHSGNNNAIVKARDAARAYFRDVILQKWTVNDSFGINYWDWMSEVQLENVTEFACRYMMDNKDYFPNWKNDVRNVLSLFLNHTSVNPSSNGEVYSGAWAYPESSSCCGRSLWYGPMEVAWPFAQYGVEANSEWAREIARRTQILATYDIHETGYSEDNIDGGPIVNTAWFKIAHPMAMKHMLQTIAWMPELFAPGRENHVVQSTSTVTEVHYRPGRIVFKTFDAPKNTVTVLRMAYIPSSIKGLSKRADLDENGYMVKKLPNGDCITRIRHDGIKQIVISGKDRQRSLGAEQLSYKGKWSDKRLAVGIDSCFVADQAGDEVSCEFSGNQVRFVGSVAPDGGLADVYLDDVKQLVGLDFYNQKIRYQETLYYTSGLNNGKHTLRVVARGEKNPYSSGTRIYANRVDYSAETGAAGFGEGGGPKGAQRVIFGYPKREDYKDSQGNLWRPATEFIVRLGKLVDSVERAWWTTPVSDEIANTRDPELYRYGVHAPDFMANFTVGPGNYHVTIKLAAVREIDTKTNPMSILINGKMVVENLHVSATAGAPNKALDLVFNDIVPRNGIIDVRFRGTDIVGSERTQMADVFAQAIEVAPGVGKGANPPLVTWPTPAGPTNPPKNE